jgi:hypothetical protein
LSRFGGVVCHEDDLLLLTAEEFKCIDGPGKQIVAGPKDAIAVEEKDLKWLLGTICSALGEDMGEKAG